MSGARKVENRASFEHELNSFLHCHFVHDALCANSAMPWLAMAHVGSSARAYALFIGVDSAMLKYQLETAGLPGVGPGSNILIDDRELTTLISTGTEAHRASSRSSTTNAGFLFLRLTIVLALLTCPVRLTALFFRSPSVLSSLLRGEGLGTIVLRHGLHDGLFFLGVDDCDGVGEGFLRAGLAFGVGAAHDLDFDAEDALAEEDVAGGAVDEVVDGLAGVDHEAVLVSGQLCKMNVLEVDLTVNFMLLALAALSFPDTTTSQPLAPLSIMKRRTP